MAELKTKQTEASVEEFLTRITDENVRQDSAKITNMMEKATSSQAKMWGSAIIGFGQRRLKYESGRELDWMEIGFSPRKQNLTLYINISALPAEDLLPQLGKYKTGKGCLYIKRLSDVDEQILEKLIDRSVENIRKGE